jgi:hypothetical protein
MPPSLKTPCCNDLKGLKCCVVSAGHISEQRGRRARIGAAACFLLTGVISASWASRLPAIKDGLALSDGQFAMALLGLEAGAVLGLQLGGLVVPRRLVPALALPGRGKGGTVGRRSSENEWLEALV